MRAWLGAGKHGSMEYLAEHIEARLDPAGVMAGAKSVVMVADFYSGRGRDGEEAAPGAGRIAKYARGLDYHEVMKGRLQALRDTLRKRYPGQWFRSFVDTAPIPEREFAARAGLGWVGKHTLLIHPRHGSYMLLGGVLTTLELRGGGAIADHCGTCTRCIDACPTHAIEPYSVDASRCIAYLTIERRGEIPAGFHREIGDWVFGCDVCQDVCPHNSARAGAGAPVREEYAERRTGLDLLEVMGWTEASRSREFSGSSLLRATLEMVKRNALIVMGNLLEAGTGSAAMRERLERAAGDAGESEMIRGTAAAVISQLSKRT